MLKRFFTGAFLLFTFSLFSKTEKPAPTPVEMLIGNNRVNLQTVIKRPISKRFEFFSLMSGAVDYKNTFAENEMVISNSVNYLITSNFKTEAGAKLQYKKGIMPGCGFIDWYGASKFKRENYGLFCKVML